MVPAVKDLPDGTKIMKTSDRAYVVEKNGALRSLKVKVSKKERMHIRKLRDEKPMFPIPQAVSMKVPNAD